MQLGPKSAGKIAPSVNEQEIQEQDIPIVEEEEIDIKDIPL
jgi:hypothetical protein